MNNTYNIQLYIAVTTREGVLPIAWVDASQHTQLQDAQAQYQRFVDSGIAPENIRVFDFDGITQLTMGQ